MDTEENENRTPERIAELLADFREWKTSCPALYSQLRLAIATAPVNRMESVAYGARYVEDKLNEKDLSLTDLKEHILRLMPLSSQIQAAETLRGLVADAKSLPKKRFNDPVLDDRAESIKKYAPGGIL